jgi:hypothetical protein
VQRFSHTNHSSLTGHANPRPYRNATLSAPCHKFVHFLQDAFGDCLINTKSLERSRS